MRNVLLDPTYSSLWNAIGAIAQGVASIMALAALILSVSTFRKSLRTSHYGDLDRMYFDLLSRRLESRHLRRTGANRTPDEESDYDIYAHMVWNFLEAIHDRCERDESLCQTWYPVIATERELHLEWLARPENVPKFKQQFRECMLGESWAKGRLS